MLPPGGALAPKVTLWRETPVNLQVTVSPAAIVTVAGENDSPGVSTVAARVGGGVPDPPPPTVTVPPCSWSWRAQEKV